MRIAIIKEFQTKKTIFDLFLLLIRKRTRTFVIDMKY